MSHCAAYGGRGPPRGGRAAGPRLSASPALLTAPSFARSLAGEERQRDAPCRLRFKHYGFLDTENVPRDSLEFALLFEQVGAVLRRGGRAVRRPVPAPLTPHAPLRLRLLAVLLLCVVAGCVQLLAQRAAGRGGTWGGCPQPGLPPPPA